MLVAHYVDAEDEKVRRALNIISVSDVLFSYMGLGLCLHRFLSSLT